MNLSVRQSTPPPTPTPTRTIKFYAIPEWVVNPAINVLLLYTSDRRDQNNAVTLINAHTGERFDIPETAGYRPKWKEIDDGTYIFLGSSFHSGDPTTTFTGVNTITGEVKLFELSPTVRNSVNIDDSVSGRTVITWINEKSDEEIELIDPFGGTYPDRVNIDWSSDDEMIMVTQLRQFEDETALYGVSAKVALAIFSTQGELLSQYSDLDSGGSAWSPVSPNRILHPTYTISSETPCIYDAAIESIDCIEEIAQWRDAHNANIGIFKWSPDGNKIGFIYWGNQAGFCYVELANRNIICPVSRDDLQVDEYISQFAMGDGIAYLHITDYFWSPDSQYVALSVDPASPESDDRTLTSVAITNLSGDHLLIIPDGKLSHFNSWRPPIPVQSEGAMGDDN